MLETNDEKNEAPTASQYKGVSEEIQKKTKGDNNIDNIKN